MITFTPLSSSARSSTSSAGELPPLAYLIQLDDIKILIDCGSPDLLKILEGEQEMEGEYEKLLREHAPTISLVLLTHSSLCHLGYFPFARSQLGLNCPVYATVPIVSMGRVACLEDAETWRAEIDGSAWEEEDVQAEEKTKDDGTEMTGVEDVGDAERAEAVAKRTRRVKWVPTAEEVVDSFESITRVKFESPTRLMGALSSLTITAFSAGHTLGGTIWKIRSPTSGTVLHAVGMNHTRERHLYGTALLKEKGEGIHEGLGRPDLLITDTDRVQWKNVKRKERDVKLLELITGTLQSQSSLLFPVDASSRLMELLILLDQHWSYSIAQAHAQGRNWIYPLCLVSRTGKQMVDFARSLMEWMGGTVAEGETSMNFNRERNGAGQEMRGHPLEFRHLRFYDSVAALTATYPASRPKLILAVPPSMSHGPSRTLFTQLASNDHTCIVLTERGLPGTLGHDLFQLWNKRQADGKKAGDGGPGDPIPMNEEFDIKVNLKVPLSGQELLDFNEVKRIELEKKNAQKAAQVQEQQLLEADDVESEDEDEDEEAEVDDELGEEIGLRRADAGGWADSSRQLSFDIYVKGQATRAASFFKSAAGNAPRFRMFPFVEKRARNVDQYGEAVDVGVWLRRGKEIEEVGEDEFVKEAKRRRLEEEEKKREEVAEPPSKFVSETHKVQMRCGLFYLDMEGLNDGRAVKTIVPQVNPRRLILVHGTASATEELVSVCKTLPNMTNEIYTPGERETVQIGENMLSYGISLSELLMSSMKMAKFEDYEVSHVTGRYTFPSNTTIPVLESLSLAPPSSTSPFSTTASPSLALPITPTSLYIGDLKLTALKLRLQTLGVRADFAGEGVLVCSSREDEGEVVAVRKLDKGRVEVEGNGLGEVFYTVKREVANLHAVV